MKLRKKGQVLMKGIDDQNAMVPKGIDQIDCKTHCHHNSRNRKAKRRTHGRDPVFPEEALPV